MGEDVKNMIEEKIEKGNLLIQDFLELPKELRQKRDVAFNRACEDSDLEDMYELSRPE